MNGIFSQHDESARPAGPRNLPLGILSISDYDQFDVELDVDDCVVTYTDALIESQDSDGEMLGEEGLLRIVRLLGDIDGPRMIQTILGEIADRYPENLSGDDVTVMVLRVNQREPYYSFAQKARALLRLSGSLIRALNPRAERPPLPDINLANLGGAIIPSLNRRWRAQPHN